MANEFTARLPEPAQVTGSTATRDSTSAAIGTALGGIAQILDVGLKYSAEERQQRVLGSVEAQLNREVTAFTQPSAEEVAADSDPEVQNVSNRLDRLRSANQQGRMSRQEFLARSNQIVSAAVASSPRFAEAIRERAANVLGVVPSSAAVALEMNEQEEERVRAKAIQDSFVQKAVDFGFYATLPDGTIDYDTMAAHGRHETSRMNDLKELGLILGLQRDRAAIEGAGQRNLTREDIINMEASTLIYGDGTYQGTNNSYNEIIKSWLTAADGQVNWNDPAQVANFEVMWGQQRGTFEVHLNDMLSAAEASPDVRAKVMSVYSEQLDQIQEMLTGENSRPQAAIRSLKNMTTNFGLTFAQAAPTAAGAAAVGLDNILNPVMDGIIAVGTESRTNLIAEGQRAISAFSGGTSNQSALNTALSALNGSTALYRQPTPAEISAGLPGVEAGVEAIVRYGANASPQELNAFSNGVDSMVVLALDGTNPVNSKNVAAKLSSPSYLRTLDLMSEVPELAAQVERTGSQMHDIARTSLSQNMKLIQPQTVTWRERLRTSEAGGPLAGVNQREVTYTPVYNPQLGRYAIEARLADGTLAEAERSSMGVRANTPPQMLENINKMNQALDLAVNTQEYGSLEIQGYSEPQLRQYIATRSSAVPLSTGSRLVTMPTEATQEQVSSFEDAVGFVFEAEGGVTNDTGGLTNMGISQRANPDVDVENLTRNQAAQIYKDRYWDAIDADNLPPDLAMVAFDAAVNQGVSQAKQWITASGGDPETYLLLRRAHYETLARRNPDRYGQYLDGWNNRLNNLEARLSRPTQTTNDNTLQLEVVDG